MIRAGWNQIVSRLGRQRSTKRLRFPPKPALRFIRLDCARVLRPRGTLLVLNYSYSGNIERDRQEVVAGARATGLQVVRDGTQDFTTWDAVTFQMVRAP
jgi:hypothetical protein